MGSSDGGCSADCVYPPRAPTYFLLFRADGRGFEEQHHGDRPCCFQKVLLRRTGVQQFANHQTDMEMELLCAGVEGSSAHAHQKAERVRHLPCCLVAVSRRVLVNRLSSPVCFSFLIRLPPGELARCRADLLSRRIALESRRNDVAEARQNCRNRQLLYTDQLVSAMRMGECAFAGSREETKSAKKYKQGRG